MEPSVEQLVRRGRAAILQEPGESAGLQKAKTAFSEVLQHDPDSAGAMTGLAAYYLHAASRQVLPPEPHLEQAEQLSDQQRLIRFNEGPEGKPLPNRLGKGLRLALERPPEAER